MKFLAKYFILFYQNNFIFLFTISQRELAQIRPNITNNYNLHKMEPLAYKKIKERLLW